MANSNNVYGKVFDAVMKSGASLFEANKVAAAAVVAQSKSSSKSEKSSSKSEKSTTVNKNDGIKSGDSKPKETPTTVEKPKPQQTSMNTGNSVFDNTYNNVFATVLSITGNRSEATKQALDAANKAKAGKAAGDYENDIETKRGGEYGQQKLSEMNRQDELLDKDVNKQQEKGYDTKDTTYTADLQDADKTLGKVTTILTDNMGNAKFDSIAVQKLSNEIDGEIDTLRDNKAELQGLADELQNKYNYYSSINNDGTYNDELTELHNSICSCNISLEAYTDAIGRLGFANNQIKGIRDTVTSSDAAAYAAVTGVDIDKLNISYVSA